MRISRKPICGITLGLILSATLAVAHGDQEITYLGTECRLPGDFERSPVKTLCDGMKAGTEWEDLQGISRFGHFANLHACGTPKDSVPTSRVPDMLHRNAGDMVVTCPVPRGAIRKGTGINVSLKVETTLLWDDSDTPEQQINKNLRCELLNIHRQGGRAAHRDDTGPHVVNSDLLQHGQSSVATIGLNLSVSNASQDFDALGAGGYVINCILPGQRGRVASQILHYTVREND